MKKFFLSALSAIALSASVFAMENSDSLNFPKDPQITKQTSQKDLNKQVTSLIDKFYRYFNQEKKFEDFSTNAIDFWGVDFSAAQGNKIIPRGFKKPGTPLSEALKALWDDKNLTLECSATRTFVVLSILQTLLGEKVMNSWAQDMEKNKKLIFLQGQDLRKSYFETGSKKYFLAPLHSYQLDFFSVKDGSIAEAPEGSFGHLVNFPSILKMDPSTCWGFENVSASEKGLLWGFGPTIWGECEPVSYEGVCQKHIGEYKRVRKEYKKKNPDENSKLNQFEDGSFVSKIVSNDPEYLKEKKVPYAPNPDIMKDKAIRKDFDLLQVAYAGRYLELDPKKLWAIVEKYSPKTETSVENQEAK